MPLSNLLTRCMENNPNEGEGANSNISELGVPVPVEESPYWTSGRWIRMGAGGRNGGSSRKQVQTTKLSGLRKMKREMRYTVGAMA